MGITRKRDLQISINCILQPRDSLFDSCAFGQNIQIYAFCDM